MKTFQFITLFIFFTLVGFGQTKTLKTTFIKGGFSQIKESANFGLVFKGCEAGVGMNREFYSEQGLLTYSNELTVNILFSHEIPGICFYLKPVDLAYRFKLPLADNFYFGPSLKLEYNYQLFPDLQSGFDYWFSNINAGAGICYNTKINHSEFQFLLNTSLAGFTSRQLVVRNPYFYDLGFTHAIKHLHQQASFGWINTFNVTDFEIKWKPSPTKKISYGYRFSYSAYFAEPEFTKIDQSLIIYF